MANLVVNNKNYTKTGNVNIGQFVDVLPLIITDKDTGDQSVTLPLYGDEISKIEIEFSPRTSNDSGYILYSQDNFYLPAFEANYAEIRIHNSEYFDIPYLNENIQRFVIDLENSQIVDLKRNIYYPIKHTQDYDFSHNPIILFSAATAAVGEIKFYDLNKELVMHLVPKKNFETGLSFYFDLISNTEFYSSVPWNYYEYNKDSIEYKQNKTKPIFSETKISTVDGTNIELSEDYHNFDFIKIKLSNTQYPNVYSDILFTPSSLDKMITISGANRVCFTYGVSSQYIILYRTDDTHLTFSSARGAQFYEMYGVNCDNYNIDVTDIYTATGRSSSNINISLEGIDLTEFDYLNLGGNSGSSDEQIPGWYLVDTKAAIYEGRYEHLLIYSSWQHIIIRPNFITPARYGVIEGIKLLPKTNT